MGDLGVVGVLGALFKDVVRAKAVPDVGVGHADVTVLLDEVAFHRPGLDEVVGNVIEDGEVRSRLEDYRNVGQVGRAVLVSGKRCDPHMRRAEAAIRHPRPQDGVHLGHVRAPQHEGVGVLEVIVAAHRLVHAEGADERDCGGCHAMAGVRVEVVGSEAGAHQL